MAALVELNIGENQKIDYARSVARLRRFKPVIELFYGPEAKHHKDEYHREDHVLRVLVHALVLTEQAKKKGVEVDEDVVVMLAVLHDVGSNGDDNPDHGDRGAAMLRLFKPDAMTDEAWEKVILGIQYHNKDEHKGQIPIEAWSTELIILKDADALDLVRMEDGREIHFLTQQAKDMLPAVEEFYRKSRSIHSGDVLEDVLMAAGETRLFSS